MRINHMRMVITVLFLIADPSLALASAEAHGAGHHAPGLSTLFWPAANFFLYAGLLLFCYRKYLRNTFEQRSVEVDEQLKKSASRLVDAQTHHERLETRLKGIAREKEELIEQFNREGEKISQAFVEQAKKSALAVKEDAERRVSGELKKATSEVRQQIVQQAVDLARQRLARELTDEKDQRLRQEALGGFIS